MSAPKPFRTAKEVENVEAAKERFELRDALLAGHYLVVQPSGAKSWAIRYRRPLDRKTRKHTIGAYPKFDLGKAREAAKAALRAVAEGRDPAAERQEQQRKEAAGDAPGATVDRTFNRFLDRYAKVHTKPASWRETKRIFDKEVLPGWTGRPIEAITKRDVIELLDRIVDRGAPVLANRVLAAVRKFFNWCVDRDLIETSPCANIKPPAKEQSRERVLTDAEIVGVWKVADRDGYPFGAILKLLLLTGQRMDEVRELPTGKEVDLDAAIWRLPGDRTKNGRPNDVPLSDAALAVLKAVPRIDGAAFVFTTTGATPFSGVSKAKERLDRELLKELKAADPEATLAHFTLHDLRRTVATGLQRLGFSIEVVEAILNHKSGVLKGVAGVYARHDFADEKKLALQAWADHVAELVKPTGKTNVVKFPAGEAARG